MTKGGSSKPNMLGRLIFGEKRKQHASPSRHRSASRNGDSMVDVLSPGGGESNKNPINLHDWAAWRMKLNEQMGNGPTERADIKQMRQFLHGNSFYQQHSRDPSNGRYNGARLLFSIPHAKLKSEIIDGAQGALNKKSTMEVGDRIKSEQNNVRLNSDDHATASSNLISVGSPMMTDKTISQLLPKGLIGNTGDFLHINEQMIAADASHTNRSVRTLHRASDRVHSTLHKAVKDGNVLEKIKAFEMQAAAAQAGLATKLVNSSSTNNRMQSATSFIQSATHRTLSPTMTHPISPIIMQHNPHQQYIRSHRNRHIHPAQQHHRGDNLGSIVGRESRKGAHVLEPAHGDIILKRRTPSQKAVNDDDYTITAMSSMALTASQGHHHRHHHQTSVSRSRHRQEMVHDKRTSNHHENVRKKHQQKPKEPRTSSSTKTSTRRRWLKGHKDTPNETVTENAKQDVSATKSKKNTKNKKKNNEQEKLELTEKSTSPIPKGKTPSSADNNGVPNTIVNEQSKFETTSSQLPSPIEEENESDREEKNIGNKKRHMSPKEEDIPQSKECNTIITTTVERRPSKAKYNQKITSTDGEILSKVDDDTRFSRPTDDHAHRSELNDEDDECKSEGDIFIEESSAATYNPHQQQLANVIQRQSSQCSTDEHPSDRRWQWSKESGGLIDKGNRKKKQQPITIVTRKNKINQGEVQVVYETPQSEPIQTSVCNTHTLKNKHTITTPGSCNESDANKQVSKHILHTIINSMNNNNSRQPTTDEFFDIGPHTNPEEIMINMTSSS